MRRFGRARRVGPFLLSLFTLILEEVRVDPFPSSVVWNAWVPPKVSFFCLGGHLGESLDFRPIKKERVVFSQ